MATRDPFLVNWVKTAYSMELGLAPVLEKQATQVQNDPEFKQSIERHLQQTRRHAQLLHDRLQALGESPSSIRPSTPAAAAYAQPAASGMDGVQHTELVDYVTEAFESASYRALKALATRLGDEETSHVCDQILEDELAMSMTLDQRLHTVETGSAVDNVAMARFNFEALNRHDLYLWGRDLGPDFRGEAPGAPGEMDQDQNRGYLQAYLVAFPDLHFDIERVISAGDQVVVYWVGSGTHTGPMAGPNGMTIPPTGKKARSKGTTMFEFKDDRISRAHVYFDSGDLLRQLGLLPGSATNAAGEPNREFVHIELPATNQQAAAEFYHKMFGWDYEHMGEPMNYTTFKTGNVGGGFAQVSEVYAPGGAILYVGSGDIDADLRKVGSLGGRTVVPKTEIPGMGWYAIFADPTGNRFGLFSM